MTIFKELNHQTILLLYVQPGASRCEIVGTHGEPARLKIKVNAQPEDGKANKAVIDFLADFLGVAKSKIELMRGHTSRQKDLLIDIPSKDLELKLKDFLK